MLEWIVSAVWANYTPQEFFDEDVDMQNLVIAAYRTSKRAEAVAQDIMIKRSQEKKK
jgi:hypothetical protein